MIWLLSHFPCMCCWHFRPIYFWRRWGGLLPKPICMYCKAVGCSRCED